MWSAALLTPLMPIAVAASPGRLIAGPPAGNWTAYPGMTYTDQQCRDLCNSKDSLASCEEVREATPGCNAINAQGPPNRGCALRSCACSNTPLRPAEAGRSGWTAAFLTQQHCPPAPAPPTPTPHPFGFANIFGDSMVLQMSPLSAVVWGYLGCTGASAVSVTLSGGAQPRMYVAAIDTAQRTWRAELGPQPAGGPFDITATANATAGSAGAQQTLADVLFGD
eukprot:gene5664-1012_t